ncbi:reverse transcriptase/maturase family protein [Terrihalobacillus insolitus]|uniref:reverse transcriptase/maturase family protein n=1 Tax=Terrihalobacillus insolitus TaxID=2950438 RepID=UPI0023427A5B|nr:reverse transcriptase/maturase family protein [Terrihalobacillus insolitus]MDC3412516.1 reverse transcriptase/maturase family protein [Terrihalobacillus insolitus]
MSQLFNEIVAVDNFDDAYNKSQKGKSKYKTDAMKFSQDLTKNLEDLRWQIFFNEYEFGEYIYFKVYEPKERDIHAPQFEDKLVQLAINNVLKHIYQPCFIYDSYACLDNKGTHKAINRVSHFIRKAAWQYGDDAFIIKLDISKFFYTIDRDVLKGILKKKIKCKRTLDLLFTIIDSANDIDSLGLPLGNLTSQLFANVYMNEFDNYCKRKLSLKYYVRYADDAIAIVKNKDEAKVILELMKRFLKRNLKLNTNEKKTRIFPIEQGVNAYGFKIYKTHRLLRNDSKKKIKRKAKKMRRLITEELMTVEKAEQILNSWKGHAKYGCSYNFIKSLLERNDYIYMNHKGILKVNVNKLKEGDVDVA